MMKKVGTNWYVHKSNVQELLDSMEGIWKPYYEKVSKMVEHPYEVIKVDRHKMSISFIDSPDWLTAKEPVVGESTKFSDFMGYEMKHFNGRKNNKQIYHSKELFVADDYTGFDMAAAKERTKLWNSIPGIVSLKKFIGNQDYWFELLDANGIER